MNSPSQMNSAIHFYKYQGTGNDFVMIDNRDKTFPRADLDLIAHLCDRRFGVGADGVILIERHTDADFEMIYYNPDGSQSLCGNGSRCAVMFANYLGIIQDKTKFLAVDGIHEAYISKGKVHLLMHDVQSFEQIGEDFLIDTGSPHYIKYVQQLDQKDMIKEGHAIRYSERFNEIGVNVNLIENTGQGLSIRTYERGVEAETLSCGTGCTAAALAYGLTHDVQKVTLIAKGGELEVHFKREQSGFKDIYLVGPAEAVFEGNISV